MKNIQSCFRLYLFFHWFYPIMFKPDAAGPAGRYRIEPVTIKVCPACYCHVCFFETGGSEHDLDYYETELEKAGYVNVLPDTLFFQLVRLFHVSASCTACGQCADVCPANIPLWAISLRSGEAVQKAFDYVPGKDIEEGIPITSFQPEEFAGI